MSTPTDRDHEDLVQEVASRMELSKLSRRSSRMSTAQTPKRFSGRVEKPRSNHPSPNGLERRRTVSTVKQYATLDDHYRTMFGLDAEGNKEEVQTFHTNTRPVSWHPSTSQHRGASTRIPTRSPLSQQTLETSATQSIPDNQIELSTYPQPPPMDPLPPYSYERAPQVDVMWSSYMHGQVPAASNPPSYSPLPYEQSSWFAADQFEHVEPASQYQHPEPQPHFPPIQQNLPEQSRDGTESRRQLVRKKSTELIGLGLYDPPESSPPPFLAGFGTMSKGLKLEETWQPPEEMEDDDDEDSSDEEEEPPRVSEQQWSHMALPIVNTNLSGQSFFFEDEVANAGTDWWYQQSKQPTAVPQDGAIGYGWF